jgi:hypothetical protein
MHSSRVGRFDMAGMAADRAGNAWHGAHSTGQFVANILNTVATANTGDTEHPSMDCRGHMPVPVGEECRRQENSKV